MESVEFEAMLNDVETRLDRLKALYEQWFQGIERLEPTIARKEVERRMVLLRKEQPRNTALRFRFQQLVQRSTTLQTYWGRVARQIEEGTYRRDLLKARKSMLASRSGRARSLEQEFDIDALEDGIGSGVDPLTTSVVPGAQKSAPEATVAAPPAPLAPPRPALSPIAPPRPAAPGTAAPRVVSPFARPAPRAPNAPAGASPPLPAQSPLPPPIAATFARPAAPPPPAVAPARAPAVATFRRPVAEPNAPRPAQPAPPAPVAQPAATSPRAATDGLSEQDLRRVYERYSEARRKNNESVVAYDTLAKNLREVAPKMSEKYGKPVDFEVVLKDGKVGLKPVPKP